MDIIQAIEIFAFVTGVAYVILEILQKNAMWVVGILTGVACSYSFGVQHLWASMGLNIYYVVVSVWGLYEWSKDAARVNAPSPSGNSEGDTPASSSSTIHLRHLDRRTALLSGIIFILGTTALYFILKAMGDPSTLLDSVVTVLSAIGTWWLAKSYPSQWIIWIVADVLSSLMCFLSGMHWMGVLYLLYFASAIYGYCHWIRRGKWVE